MKHCTAQHFYYHIFHRQSFPSKQLIDTTRPFSPTFSNKVHLEWFVDSKMYLFWEHGVRCGIATCNKKYDIANNLYIPENVDKN